MNALPIHGRMALMLRLQDSSIAAQIGSSSSRSPSTQDSKPACYSKWPLFTPHELIITPEVYDKLGQQHLHTTSESSLCSCYIVHCCCVIFHVCCPIILGALECRRERALTFERSGMCKTMQSQIWSSPPFQSSPVQRLYTAGYEHASTLAVFRA